MSLRLAAMLAGLLLVLAAITRLGQPETHRAIGQVLGEPTPTAVSTAAPDGPPLVSGAVFDPVEDNAPFRTKEQPAWFTVIDAVRSDPPETLAARSLGPAGYAALSTQPDAYRGRVVTVAGKAMRVEEVTPAANEQGVETLWRVTLQPAGGEVWPITVYTLEAPQPADEPYDASAVGVFFKKLSYRWAEGVGVTPVVVATRLETTLAPAVVQAAQPPTDPTPEVDFATPTTGSLGRALLADLGVDLTALDAVEDQRPLTAQDAEAFYATLGAVAKTPPTQLVRFARAGLADYADRRTAAPATTVRALQTQRAIETDRRRDRYSVVPLFGEGADERGELVVLDAVVRRVVRVDASDSQAAEDQGVTHYYELEAFTEDSQNLPVVFVVRELPSGFPVGDALRQPARLAGFFFKQWAYRTRKPGADASTDRRQFAPLLVGRAPIPLAAPAPPRRPGLLIGVAATAGLAAVVLALWRLAGRDRRYEAATLSRFRVSGEGDPHDFAKLEELADSP